jgi:hypothetical protein
MMTFLLSCSCPVLLARWRAGALKRRVCRSLDPAWLVPPSLLACGRSVGPSVRSPCTSVRCVCRCFSQFNVRRVAVQSLRPAPAIAVASDCSSIFVRLPAISVRLSSFSVLSPPFNRWRFDMTSTTGGMAPDGSNWLHKAAVERMSSG